MVRLYHRNHFWALRLNMGLKQCMYWWCRKLADCDE